MPTHKPIDPNNLPKHHHQLTGAVRKRCADGFDGTFARARVEGATLGVFEDGVEADTPFVGRALANIVKPQGTGRRSRDGTSPSTSTSRTTS